MLAMTPWVRKLLIANIVMFAVSMPYPLSIWLSVSIRQTFLFGLGRWFLHVPACGPHASAFQYDRPLLFRTPSGRQAGCEGIPLALLPFWVRSSALPFHILASVPGRRCFWCGVWHPFLAFALYWPRVRIYLWAILPIEAWLLATLLVFGSLYAGVNPSMGSRTAHFAHLGGIVFAFVFIKWGGVA
ncbi:MAG: hypothetical protein Ct9H300mP15_00150 [Gemmatimonadota bacterium]|nr:MAG: hypothetical protein Ct9H300mP15_00150 [Gemmatimonadota bacterium]